MLSTCCMQFGCGRAAAGSSIHRPLHLSTYLFSLQTNNTLSSCAVGLLSYCIYPYLHSAEWERGSFFFILLYQAERKQQSQLCDDALLLWSNEVTLSSDIVCAGCIDMVINTTKRKHEFPVDYWYLNTKSRWSFFLRLHKNTNLTCLLCPFITDVVSVGFVSFQTNSAIQL